MSAREWANYFEGLSCDVMEAGRKLAADALAHVRPHAAGDLWRRWIKQWPWLAETAERSRNGAEQDEAGDGNDVQRGWPEGREDTGGDAGK